MTIDHDAFRAVLGRFTAGVTVVTTIGPGGRDQGMTVSAFCSLSLTPPLVLICIDHAASMYESLKLASHFVVNILCEDQEALARRFSGTDPNRFDGIGYNRGQTGLAVLDDVLGFVECRVSARQEGGDHDVFFGEVEFAGASDGKPLLYYRGDTLNWSVDHVPGLLTPRRRRGIELLDDPCIAPEIVTRSMADVARSNLIFGGARAAIQELRPTISGLQDRATMLDVGTGAGDIPTRARHTAAKAGVALWTIGIDMAEPLVSTHRARNSVVVRGNGLSLPFRDASVDIVMCSQLLHHFTTADAVTLIREMDRVARRRVVISDLRRSWFAAGGIWLTSFAMGFHSVSRHDGVVSVMRGFTGSELADIVEAAVGDRHPVIRRPGFRLTMSWTPR